MSADEASSSATTALLRFLKNEGSVPQEPLQKLERQKIDRATVFEALEEAGILRELELAELLARTLRLPLIELSTFPISPLLASVLKENVAIKYEVVPIRADDSSVEIATANPLDREAIKAVEFATGRRVKLAVTTRSDLLRGIQNLYRLDESIQEYIDDEGAPGKQVEAWEEKSEGPIDVDDTEAAPVVRLADRILVEATGHGASDVHIEPAQDAVVVRYRIDGLLEEAFRFPRKLQQPLVGRFKIMAELDIAERRVPQDGRTKIRVRDRLVDFRVSSLPTHVGEKITLRILDSTQGLRPLEDLGLLPRDLETLCETAQRPEGMILVTGPTGSGKTTTLYALLQRLQSIAQNIVTIENPVEYRIPGLNQVEVNLKQGLTFAKVLRSVLRQDPDVILVGEIRDDETAQIAFQAAQTGHLVLSTLHTNDSAATVTRLLDLGMEKFLVASTLNLVVAQRLMRRVCPDCKGPAEPDPAILKRFHFADDLAAKMRQGRGCQRCRSTGYRGRIGIYEMLRVSHAVGRIIESTASETQLREQARREGAHLLIDDAEVKLREGITTLEEVSRVVQVSDQTLRCPSCAKEVGEDFAVCPHCSTTLKRNCTSCERSLEGEWARCPYCGTEAPPTSSETYAPRTFKALVVDDDISLRHMVRAALERSDLELTVLTAQDGEEALALAAIERPDVVIMDYTMPGMTGVQTCRKMREDPNLRDVPVLMLTAHDDGERVEQGFAAGVDDYVLKPFRPNELVARLRRMLERAYGRGAVPQPGAAPPAA